MYDDAFSQEQLAKWFQAGCDHLRLQGIDPDRLIAEASKNIPALLPPRITVAPHTREAQEAIDAYFGKKKDPPPPIVVAPHTREIPES